MYGQARIEASILPQLEGLDRESLLAKKDLILGKSVAELQSSIAEGKLNYSELCAFYLQRILDVDQKDGGLNAFLEVNPKAMEQARAFDKNKAQAKSPLYGMPTTIKDNIMVADLPFSAGTYILQDFIANEDAALVQKLKEAEVLILGKVNLSELANFVDMRMPDGYSSKGGLTLNPFAPLEITASGSSTGSAVSLAANLCVLSVGTETSGSIVGPAQANGVVGLKPSVGNVNTQGVFPLSSTLDVAGPMARTISDLALLYAAITSHPETAIDVPSLSLKALQGKRLGLLPSQNPLSEKVQGLLQGLGAELIPCDFPSQRGSLSHIIFNECKADMAKFAKAHKLPFQSLSELIAYNRQDKPRRARYGQGLLELANYIDAPDYENNLALQAEARDALTKHMQSLKLDAFVGMNADNVVYAALAGTPVLTVPFGMLNKEPQSLSFYGLQGSEGELLRMGYAFEQTVEKKLIPALD